MSENDVVSGFSDWMASLVQWTQELNPQAIAQRMPDAVMPLGPQDAAHWAKIGQQLQTMWLEFQAEQGQQSLATSWFPVAEPGLWLAPMAFWNEQLPMMQPGAPQQLWESGLAAWQSVLDRFGVSAPAADTRRRATPLPQDSDKRFADPLWQQPFYAMVQQSYRLMASQITALADNLEGVDPRKKEQLRFATAALLDALSPDHFPMTNPLVLDRALATRGESLVNGMRNLLTDLRRGQLTHTDPAAFQLGKNLAVTPGKVVHETGLFQLIQYTPTTAQVLEVPLVIFPPWINRFYILDLNPQKSFVQWAVAQGITVFMVSWRSADAAMAEVVWDDYIRSQVEAIEVVRSRLAVPAVHAIGYCVAGTTLAATLAVLGRLGHADMVKSATFFTAQVDFEQSGALRHLIDDQQIAAIGNLATDGYVDGRYMAAAFNMLRGNDLIWNYVVRNYLLGEEYAPFDLLHWNGDTTNLPVKWHQSYLRDLYLDNRLVVPDALSAGGTPIDLRYINVPCYIQAGREDHIAPAPSVWQLTRHITGSWVFVLAGSGHIAGVVNPPSAAKYQYWTNPEPGETLDSFVAGASVHPGSWWPHWERWLRTQDDAQTAATGKRIPGEAGDDVIEDAPGRYVMTP